MLSAVTESNLKTLATCPSYQMHTWQTPFAGENLCIYPLTPLWWKKRRRKETHTDGTQAQQRHQSRFWWVKIFLGNLGRAETVTVSSVHLVTRFYWAPTLCKALEPDWRENNPDPQEHPVTEVHGTTALSCCRGAPLAKSFPLRVLDTPFPRKWDNQF